MSARALSLGVAIALLGGCAARDLWGVDESERIDQIIRREPFCEHSQGAQGIAVQSAPPIAPPYPPEETYRFRTEHDRRVSNSRAQVAPRAQGRASGASRLNR